MQIVSRSGGARGLLPYETAGLKDTVFLTPGEVVHVLAYYGPWNGLYMVSHSSCVPCSAIEMHC
jgi:bilirubin oxidase